MVIDAEIKDILEAKGYIVGNTDLLISACVIDLNSVLVSHNLQDFIHLPGVQLENGMNT